MPRTRRLRNVIKKHLANMAKARFQARVRAFEACTNEEFDEMDIEEEVARGVTREMLERVAERLLKGTSYCLRDNGTLFITELPDDTHDQVHGEITRQLSTYAYESGLDFGIMAKYHFPPIRQSDLRLVRPLDDSNGRQNSAILVAEVEVAHRSVKVHIHVAREYLANPAVQRVIGICIFRPRSPTRRNRHWQFAALAMAFGRDPTTNQVCILAESSFGNAPLTKGVLDNLVSTPSIREPAGRVVRLVPSPFMGVEAPIGGVIAALSAMQAWFRDVAIFVVSLPSYPDLQINLWELFANAARGLHVHTTQAGQYPQPQ